MDNDAKGCLDDVALNLQRSADASIVIVGNAAPTPPPAKGKRQPKEIPNLAAQRAVNTKAYLVTEKGIDPSRVAVETGSTEGKTVEDYLVPAGATFGSDVQGVSTK